MEFAVKYDDGVGAGLDEADIVLVGVSRTSKTPLSIYLGYLGHKVANVPIVKGIAPPKELFELDPAKIVGLTIQPGPPRGDPAGARAQSRCQQPPLCGADGGLRRARRGDRGTAAARVPGNRHLELSIEETAQRILRAGRGPAARRSGAGPREDRSRRCPCGAGPIWWGFLGVALVVFYVLLTPLWLGLRGLAWLAEFRARRRR